MATQAFDPQAFAALVQKYQQQMSANAGYPTGPIMSTAPAAEQPNILADPIKEAVKGYLQKQAFSSLANSAPSVLSSGLPSAPLAGQPGISSGIIESLNAASAGPTVASAGVEPGISLAGTLPGVAAAPLAVMTAIKSAQGLKSVAKGKDLSTMQAAALALPTFGASFLYNPIKNKFFGQKSTQEHKNDITKSLLGASADPTYQAYVQGMREKFKTGPKDPSKPFGGKYSSFDEYKKAGLQANDLTGVAGNIQAGGDQWAKLQQSQREAITQQAINKDLYYSSKGDVKVKDHKAFQDLIKSYLAGANGRAS